MHLQHARNASCSGDSVPADLGIPKNLTYAVVPSTNAPDKWMATCCETNPVHVIKGCWEWCELPANLTKEGSDAATGSFQSCLAANGQVANESRALEVHFASAATATGPAAGDTLALLVVVMAMMHIL